MADALSAIRRAYEDREAEARRRGAAGQKVVGYLSANVPDELILAAGCFPVRLSGDWRRPATRADVYMEEYFDGEVRSLMQRCLDGELAYLDLLVIPRTSEVHLQLYYFLLAMPEWEPAAKIPPLYLWDLLQTPYWTTTEYVQGRVRDFAQRLEAVSGKVIDAEALRAGIETANENRRLVNELRPAWAGADRWLSGVDALRVMSTAGFMGRAEHSKQVNSLSAAPRKASGDGRKRVVIKGSPLSDVRLTALVEGCGLDVVAHDHCWGDLSDREMVDASGQTLDELLNAVAWRYQRHSPSPRAYPLARQDAAFLALVRDAKADGVIFYHDEWDDTLGWEYPDQRISLQAMGVPSLFMKRQPYFDPPEQEQRARIEAFAKELGSTEAVR